MAQVWPTPGSDSGWQNITLAAGWTALGSPNRGAIARVVGGVVYGSIAATNSSNVSANAIVGTLPAACRPAAVVHVTMRSVGLVRVVLYPNGDVQVADAISSSAGLFGSFAFPLG